MNCPACKQTLIVLEHDQIEIDFCVQCEGIWLDAGELELLAGERSAAAQLVAAGVPAPASAGRRRRKCPICRKKMQEVVSSGDQPVTYDRCPRGDGLWFDRGELAQLLEQRDLHGNQVVLGFLRQIFPGPKE